MMEAKIIVRSGVVSRSKRTAEQFPDNRRIPFCVLRGPAARFTEMGRHVPCRAQRGQGGVARPGTPSRAFLSLVADRLGCPVGPTSPLHQGSRRTRVQTSLRAWTPSTTRSTTSRTTQRRSIDAFPTLRLVAEKGAAGSSPSVPGGPIYRTDMTAKEL